MKGAQAAAVSETLARAVAEGIYDAYHSLQTTVAPALNDLGLSPSLADALWQLDPASGPQPRISLARKLQCDPSNVTILVDKLEALGLVERFADPHDRRIRAIGLTRSGIAARDKLVAAVAHAPLLTHLSHRELQRLAELLLTGSDPKRSAATPTD